MKQLVNIFNPPPPHKIDILVNKTCFIMHSGYCRFYSMESNGFLNFHFIKGYRISSFEKLTALILIWYFEVTCVTRDGKFMSVAIKVV